jgi:xanthine dehydrogenase small subunit
MTARTRGVTPMSDGLCFLVNGELADATHVPPQTTLLEFLREARRLTGTKEGCAEGDCGACTVVVAEARDGRLAWKPVNACIHLLPMLAGKAVFTVESLATGDGALHPVQQALVDSHGSQCGFCTPGFAMSLFALYKNSHRPQREAIDDALSGNLCRCTGYRPILAAAQRMADLPAPAGWRGPGVSPDGVRQSSVEEERLADLLASIAPGGTIEGGAADQRWIAPGSEEALAQALTVHPDARIVAGATDVGLWVTKQHRDLGTLVFSGAAKDMTSIARDDDAFTIGAAASLADAFAALDDDYPELREAWVRFASPPIRHAGTLGGNVANGSPIGDSMPVLIALGGSIVLRKGEARRELALEDFYVGYQKNALVPGEFVAAVRVPRRRDPLLLRAWKASRRFDQDISAVFACFALRIRDGVVAEARIGCGGVAPVPARARRTEAALQRRPWSRETAAHASRALASEFTPIDDMRASAAHRRALLANFATRLWLDAGERVPTRIAGARLPA